MRRLIKKAWRRVNRRTRPAILMYHRVGDSRLDPWGLSVPPAVFRDQLDAIKASRQVLSMDEMVRLLKENALPRKAVAITFDDGYADNFVTARPLLEEAGLPATIFITTASIGSEAAFWWDELAHMIFSCPRAVRGTVQIGSEQIVLALPAIGEDRPPERKWRADQPPQSAREKAYLAIWKQLQVRSPDDREQNMRELREIFPPAPPLPEDRPMSLSQARDIVSDLISIGGHAQRHHPLPTLPLEERRREIEGSRRDCAMFSGSLPTGFAYPHGERDADTMQLVENAGYSWACSTRWAAIDRSNYNLFDLPRIGVNAWSGRELVRQLDRLSV
jgi:peptidoglycan/xylan/chitin deacetylase (PgdA/CDA1 family)